MSSITKAGSDVSVLPWSLLPLAKSHLRVDGNYDDAYISSAIGRAINWFERVTNVSVNPVTWVWSPEQANFCNGVAQVPVSPVNSFTVDAGGDVSADYAITTMSTHGIGLYALAGSYVDGMRVSIPSGYPDANAIDFGITDAVLRYTSHLYENREILVPGVDAQTPGWMSDVVATYWMPRC
jgi:Phage gp6-like head-tail connector protein